MVTISTRREPMFTQEEIVGGIDALSACGRIL